MQTVNFQCVNIANISPQWIREKMFDTNKVKREYYEVDERCLYPY